MEVKNASTPSADGKKIDLPSDSKPKRDYTGTYIALIPLPMASNMEAFAKQFVDSNDLFVHPDVNHGDPFERDPHITVLLGLPALTPSVEKALGSTGAFKVVLQGLDFFPMSKTTESGDKLEWDLCYIKAAASDVRLYQLRTHLVNLTDTQPEYFEFQPHCTYFHVKKGLGLKYMSVSYPRTEFAIDSLEWRMFKDHSGKKSIISLDTSATPHALADDIRPIEVQASATSVTRGAESSSSTGFGSCLQFHVSCQRYQRVMSGAASEPR